MPPSPRFLPRLFLSLSLLAMGWALVPSARAGSPVPRQDAPTGAAKTWMAFCSSCHGPVGKGDGRVATAIQKPPPDMSTPEWQRTHTDETIRTSILTGTGGRGGSAAMPAFERVLKAGEAEALVKYIRTMKDY